jgi:hypothetical protein
MKSMGPRALAAEASEPMHNLKRELKIFRGREGGAP